MLGEARYKPSWKSGGLITVPMKSLRSGIDEMYLVDDVVVRTWCSVGQSGGCAPAMTEVADCLNGECSNVAVGLTIVLCSDGAIDRLRQVILNGEADGGCV